MTRRDQHRLAVSKLVLLVLAALGIATVVWLSWVQTRQEPINSFEDCVNAGNPVQESYPEACTTSDGRRFTKGEMGSPARMLVIREWNVSLPLITVTHDAYYTYDKDQDTVVLSTRTLDNLRDQIDGCTSGLRGPVIERVRVGDKKSDDTTWTAEELQQLSAAKDGYYYLEKGMIEAACMPESSTTTDRILAIRESLETALKNIK